MLVLVPNQLDVESIFCDFSAITGRVTFQVIILSVVCGVASYETSETVGRMTWYAPALIITLFNGQPQDFTPILTRMRHSYIVRSRFTADLVDC